MALNSKNYKKIKSILQAITPEESNPFSLWKQWCGEFSFENNYPVRNGVELTIINRSAKHCVCGHWTGKKDKNPLGEIAPLSTPDDSVNSVADEVGEQELRRVKEEKDKLLLERSFEDCSLIPYYLGNNFLLAGKKCVKHFEGTSEESNEKIIYIRQGEKMTASRIHPVFDKSGLRQKLIEVSKVRHLPENLMYFATPVSISSKHALFEVSKSIDPYGYKDLIGIDRIHRKKGIESPIRWSIDTASVKCLYVGFIELGDMIYMKLNFVECEKYPSIGVIQEHQIFSIRPWNRDKSQSITTEEIIGMRSGVDSD